MGVSVPQMPRTTNLRVLFFVFVCYCFAMSTVFQAFFTSFLVASGYGKEIASFDQAMHSDLMYGGDALYESSLPLSSIRDPKRLKLRKNECRSLNICLKGLFTEGDCQPFLQDKMLNLDIR
jgi:hypothetical protein